MAPEGIIVAAVCNSILVILGCRLPLTICSFPEQLLLGTFVVHSRQVAAVHPLGTLTSMSPSSLNLASITCITAVHAHICQTPVRPAIGPKGGDIQSRTLSMSVDSPQQHRNDIIVAVLCAKQGLASHHLIAQHP